MRIFDRKFRNNKLRYVLQCFLATVSVSVVLLLLNAIANPAIIAALGASSFIAFAMPRARVSRPRYLVGGYLIGMGSGTACYYMCAWTGFGMGALAAEYAHIVAAALAVGIAIFLMAVTNTEHPPASGVALGLALSEKLHFLTLIVLLVGIVALCAIKTLIKPFIINLVETGPTEPDIARGTPAGKV